MAFPASIKTAMTNWRTGFRRVIGDSEYYTVQGNGPRGSLGTFYIDPKTYLIKRLVRYAPSPVGNVSVQIDYDDWKDVNPKIWSPTYIALYKLAAQDPEVERVLANPAIKKALCRDVKGDRSWLHKIRPVLGHNYHLHVRISCPKDSPECKTQPVTPNDEGCGKDLEWWFKPKPRELMIKPGGASKPILMSALPPACQKILKE